MIRLQNWIINENKKVLSTYLQDHKDKFSISSFQNHFWRSGLSLTISDNNKSRNLIMCQKRLP